MGAGDDLAGNLPAGDDLTFLLPPGRVVPAWQGLLLDTETRDYPIDANGFYIPLHPIDVRVRNAMIVIAGSIKTAPSVGNKILAERFITSQSVTNARYEVNRVLKDEIAAGNIEIVDLTVTEQGTSGLRVELSYYNLVINPERTTVKKAQVPIRG